VVHEADIFDPEMFKAVTWQRCRVCSAELMAGAQPNAPRYVRVHSQAATVKIVAADEDQLVQPAHSWLNSSLASARATRRRQSRRLSWSPTSEERGTVSCLPRYCARSRLVLLIASVHQVVWSHDCTARSMTKVASVARNLSSTTDRASFLLICSPKTAQNWCIACLSSFRTPVALRSPPATQQQAK
jgi:hypothetical protein